MAVSQPTHCILAMKSPITTIHYLICVCVDKRFRYFIPLGWGVGDEGEELFLITHSLYTNIKETHSSPPPLGVLDKLSQINE